MNEHTNKDCVVKFLDVFNEDDVAKIMALDQSEEFTESMARLLLIQAILKGEYEVIG